MTAEPTPARVATRTLRQDDLDAFAALSGDDNPIHVDPAFAATTPFRVPVAHGMFLFSLVRGQLRRLLPDHHLVSQQLMFPEPTPVGATVAVRVTVDEESDEGTVVETTVEHDGHVGLRGRAVLRPDAPAGSDRGGADPTPAPTDAEGWWATAVGRTATTSRTVTAEEVARLDALAGDTTPPGQVPLPVIAGTFSRLLGVELPGPGTNYLKQDLRVHGIARVGEQLAASVTVVRVRPHRRLVDLDARCWTADGTTVCRGRALVLARGVTPPGGG